MAAIVDGLFSLCVTLGVVPVIRCPKGGVAEHVAAQLDGKLRCALLAGCKLTWGGQAGAARSWGRQAAPDRRPRKPLEEGR